MAILCNCGIDMASVDAVDSQAQCPEGDLGLGNLADLLTHQGGADRGFERDLAGLEVHLVGADYLESHSGICREVRELDPAEKAYSVFRESSRVYHAGMLQDLLQETYTADGFRLVPPRFPVARILAQVPLGASLRKVGFHFWIDLVDKVLQLGRNLVVSLLRKVFHSIYPITGITKIRKKLHRQFKEEMAAFVMV